MGTVLIPIPKDITPLILSLLPSGLSPATINLITNVSNNLANEYITVNEIYNFVLQAIPGIRDFFSTIALESTLKNTFQGYTNIWLPFQYALFIGIIIVAMTILILIGVVDIFEGFVIMISFILLLIVFGLIEYDALATFVTNRETEFKNLFTTSFNNLAGTTLLNGALGYVAGSQLTINGPTGPGNVPLNGPIILNDSNSVFKLFPPSYKVTIFQTKSTGTSPQPEVFSVQLQELDQTVIQGVTLNFNTIKFQYGKLIYLVNGNPPFKYPLLGGNSLSPTDKGIIKIINATSSYPAVGNLSVGPNIDEVPLSSLDPPFEIPIGLPPYANPAQTNNGVLIFPGETKAFVNAGYNQPLPPSSVSGLPNMGFSTWIEVTSDIRPLSSVLNSNSMTPINLRPTTKIVFLQVPTNANIDLTTSASTNVAVNGQELYLIANPPSGSINIILESGITTVLPKNSLCFLTLNNTVWVQNYP